MTPPPLPRRALPRPPVDQFTTAVRQVRPLGGASQPEAAALEGLSLGDVGEAARLRLLHDELLRLGYLPASFARDAAYGASFELRTEAAVLRLQAENGVEPSGMIDAATVQALQQPRPKVEPALELLFEAQRARLGLPMGPGLIQADGSLKQRFERAVVRVAQGRAHVCDQAGTPLLPPQRLRPAGERPALGSAAEADRYFLTAWGGGRGSVAALASGELECGPAAALTALSALGLQPLPRPGEAEPALDHLRDLCGAAPGGRFAALGRAVSAMGALVRELEPSPAAVAEVVAAGEVALLCGDARVAWGASLASADRYVDRPVPGQHVIAVLGRDAQGLFLVADPLCTAGVQELSERALATFLAEGNAPAAWAVGR